MRLGFALLFLGCGTRTELPSGDSDARVCIPRAVSEPVVEVAPGCVYADGRCAAPCVAETAYAIDCSATCSRQVTVACVPDDRCASMSCAVDPASGQLYQFTCSRRSHNEDWKPCDQVQKQAAFEVVYTRRGRCD